MLLLSISFLLFQCSALQTPSPRDIAKLQTVSETKDILFSLASDQMAGRDMRSGGYPMAATYVANYFKSNAIEPFFETGYKDAFTLNDVTSYNVVAKIGTYDPERPTILIGAHLDHIGISTKTKDSIYNGANDNASGSTAVLQIAKVLSKYKWEQNIVIALFAAEEKGLLGAKHLADRFQKEKVSLQLMFNFEMIGKTLTTGANRVYMTGYKMSDLPAVMNRFTPNFVTFLPEAEGYNLFKRSDNYAFYQTFGVPCHTLSSFDFKNYDYYHKAEDEAESLDVENMNQIIRTSTYSIGQVLRSKAVITVNE
jgi:bacterial leucyl aminopeptidase